MPVPKVSFVVPTLNRRGSVNRAVRSCLRQELPGRQVELEVIVLDSESDDGSWQELLAEFSSDPRVLLRQNARGLGPVRSWLDAATYVTGDFVTFVWSDDFLFDRYLPSVLSPLLESDSMLCISHGVVRDIADSSPPPPLGTEPWPGAGTVNTGTVVVSWLDAVAAFTETAPGHGWLAPASPLAALFRREAFDVWMARVSGFAHASKLAERVLWQKAIGPDLYLFLVALECASRSTPITIAPAPVAQFSMHPGSISIETLATQPWWLEVGYWLTRAMWLAQLEQPLPHSLTTAACVRLCSVGAALANRALDVADSSLTPQQSIADIGSVVAGLSAGL